jgi:DNA-binding Lrp family transcriptional regulator
VKFGPITFIFELTIIRHKNMTRRRLAEADKKIMKILLKPGGQKITSRIIAHKVGIPLATVQRKRKLLEEKYLSLSYSLELKKFGWRIVELLIGTEGGLTNLIGKALLGRDEVVYVGKTIGEHTIDLKTQVIIRDNGQLLDIIEDVKKMRGVKDVEWIEIISKVGRKSVPTYVIDNLGS